MRLVTAFLLLLVTLHSAAQNKSATINGRVTDENDKALASVSITILGNSTGVLTNDSGSFSIKVFPGKAFALLLSHTGYLSVQRNFFLSDGENETIEVRMLKNGKVLETVVVQEERERRENSLLRINPKNALNLPSTTGGVEGLIKTLVGSNNELSSQYNVRGGNYDENLIYINDFEIFRPYLVSSGQQEGLSMINPELARNINFYTGGFQSKYGDKMSSVLDIQYKKPTSFGGSAYVSLLEQGLHVEGSARSGAVTYLVGVRNKSNRSLVSSQPTQGSYIPSASDAQAYITFKLSQKWSLELLGILSASRFNFYPESVKKTAAVFSPLFTSNVGLDIFFEGQEKDSYSSTLAGASIMHSPVKNTHLKWMLSRFTDKENENYDIAGAYLFGERNFDRSSALFGNIVNPLGQGYYQTYARNKLNIEVWNASHKGSLDKGKHFVQWGTTVELTKIIDQLNQFEYQDSAGYSLPYSTSRLNLFNSQHNNSTLNIKKYSGYLQDNIHLSRGKNDIIIQAGIRLNYNDLNREVLVSPRIQASWKPGIAKNIVYKLAAGVYDQPPFYRELRKTDGSLNKDVKSQKSYQLVGGIDYSFEGPGGRAFRLSSEAYYKLMHDVVVYDIDNVKIRYLGNNNAKAYSAGLELRLFGELTKDAESWLSLAFMRTRENLDGDFFYQYKNAAGEVINATSTDQVVTDSVKNDVGWLRRPSDRLITMGLFLEDYLATNKNFKVHLNLIYGSNMSYNIPGSVRYRNGLIIEPYIRADIGFSALLLGEESARRSHSPFHNLKNIWLSLEVFNLINRANTISYQLIKDFSNSTYAIPNRLTPRQLNLKLVGRF